MIKTGAVCGRFQIFHLDHLAYVLAAAQKCEHLIIGITSPDASVSPEEATDQNRGKAKENPCTYYERMKMIESALLEAGLRRDRFDIVPFPIGKPELLQYYLPDEATVFVTILDQWGYAKKERLEEYGYRVFVLWEREEKRLSSTMIRKCIMQDQEWREFVPDATYKYVTEQGIDERIKRISYREECPETKEHSEWFRKDSCRS